jgi:hypothetical protein
VQVYHRILAVKVGSEIPSREGEWSDIGNRDAPCLEPGASHDPGDDVQPPGFYRRARKGGSCDATDGHVMSSVPRPRRA